MYTQLASCSLVQGIALCTCMHAHADLEWKNKCKCKGACEENEVRSNQFSLHRSCRCTVSQCRSYFTILFGLVRVSPLPRALLCLVLSAVLVSWASTRFSNVIYCSENLEKSARLLFLSVVECERAKAPRSVLASCLELPGFVCVRSRRCRQARNSFNRTGRTGSLWRPLRSA